MKVAIWILAMLAVGSTAMAQNAKLELVGEGHSRAAAEFMKITISAESLCKTTAQGVRQDLDLLVHRVTGILEPYLDKTVVGQIQVLPSAANRDAVVIYDGNGERRTLCAQGKAWTARTTLVFKLTYLTKLEDLQDAVLGLNTDDERSSLQMAAPQPGVFSETYDRLVNLALENAVLDAERQAQILLPRTGGKNLSLTKVQPTRESSGGVSYDRTELGSNESAQNQTSVAVSVARLFTFLVK